MPNNKKHTLKTIKKRDEIHPSSRKARQLTRVYMRKERLVQQAKQNKYINPKVERYIWFRDALDSSLLCTSIEEMHELIKMYLNRHNEKQKPNRPNRNRAKSTKESLQDIHVETQRAEYKVGFELPDLTSEDNVKYLRAWNGDRNALPNIASIHLCAPKKPIYDSTMAVKENVSEEKPADMISDVDMDTTSTPLL